MFKFSLPLQRSSWVSPFPVHGPTSKPPGRSRKPALPNSPAAAHTAQKARSKATSEGLRSGGIEVTTALWTPVAIWGSNCRLYDAMAACGSPSACCWRCALFGMLLLRDAMPAYSLAVRNLLCRWRAQSIHSGKQWSTQTKCTSQRLSAFNTSIFSDNLQQFSLWVIIQTCVQLACMPNC